ncbi:MAG: hypothetical protein GKR89_25555 [Candidatus Latescibacteria bacterium]|nr:hypothetical protein [Candidatus Latescibacterota bacterium]
MSRLPISLLGSVLCALFLALPSGARNADFNGNGRVDMADFLLFSHHFESPFSESSRPFDLDGNAQIDFADFLDFVDQFGGPATLDPQPLQELISALQDLPARQGPQPEETYRVPHLQLTQIAPDDMYDQLAASVARLPGLTVQPVQLLEPGLGWHLEPGLEGGPDIERYANGGSIGHLHSRAQGSMHLFLPRGLFREIVRPQGWGTLHPFSAMLGVGSAHSDLVMIWAPRNAEDLEVVWLIVQAAFAYGTGQLPTP